MIKLIDLRLNEDHELLDQFIALYTSTFTDPREKENPELWAENMWGGKQLNPRTHILVAQENQRLLGGVAFEYYQESRNGLITYLAVIPGYRKRGLARALLNESRQILENEARQAGKALNYILAEVEDPSKIKDSNGFDPKTRIEVFARLGAKIVGIPYIQPKLEGGAGSCDYLLLIAMFESGNYIPGSLLKLFFREFFIATGTMNPELDRVYIKLIGSITDRVPLTPI